MPFCGIHLIIFFYITTECSVLHEPSDENEGVSPSLNQTHNQAKRCLCENQSIIKTFLCLTRGAQVNYNWS